MPQLNVIVVVSSPNSKMGGVNEGSESEYLYRAEADARCLSRQQRIEKEGLLMEGISPSVMVHVHGF